MMRLPVCLTVGGSDSCGGAGIQADLRVFADLGVMGCSAITALTAQNHARITRVEPVSLAQLDAELHAIFDMYDVRAVKTGMLFDAEHVATLSACLDLYHVGKPLVVDPVVVSSSGHRLLAEGAVETLRHTLIKQATLVTPNLDEAALFLGRNVADTMVDVAQLRSQLGCAVLLKGGHATGNLCVDLLCEHAENIHIFEHVRQDWSGYQAHGTGCRLASAVAVYLANGAGLHEACEQAVAYGQNHSIKE